MSETGIKKDLLSQLLYEAQAYKKFEDIEKLVESGVDLAVVPVQPLYVSLQNTSKDQVASILPKLSSEQRQALRDIDLWNKDTVNPDNALYWMEVYSKVTDEEVILEYLKSEDFLLSLKGQFSVATFDVEDPMYPDDDNYFLTEDNQLIVEYGPDFNLVQELKEMIRRLYSDMGVEYAYAFLFKMVVDSYVTMEEASYQEKMDRLRDYGFVDYYEAQEFNVPFLKLSAIEDFIKAKRGETGEVDSVSMNQTLHATTLISYQSGMESLKDALLSVTDEKRIQFLHFNFIRLVNARMTLEDALKGGSLAMGRVGQQTKQALELGFEFTKARFSNDKGKTLFDIFDFSDLYKIGRSLLELPKKDLKLALAKTPFDKDEFSYFLGMYWNAFIENSLEETTKFKFDGSSKALEVSSLSGFELWKGAMETLSKSLPFIQTFFLTIDKLKSEGHLNDQFYLNYEVDNIDFEAIMISSFINFSAGHYEEEVRGKMGVTVSELKNFYQNFFKKNGNEYLIKGLEDSSLQDLITKFAEKFGLKEIPNFDRYLYQIMVEQLNGYEIDSMDEEEFRHIGGPILLNNARN